MDFASVSHRLATLRAVLFAVGGLVLSALFMLRVVQRDPRSGVPHDDLASAVLLGRYGSFEVRIGKRVVLDLHGDDLRALPDFRWLGKLRQVAAVRFRDSTLDISD